MDSLAGKVALVTGASRGIGFSIAEAFAACGATVILNGRHESSLRERADTLKAKGYSAERAVFDTADEIAVEEAFERISNLHGRLDILVNNAGVARRLNVFETTLADWKEVLDTNLTGPFLCSRSALSPMRERKSGRIIMIGSLAGQRGNPAGVVSYSASKAGLLGLVQTLAHTAADFGVTVNMIAPGLIETDALKASFGSNLEAVTEQVPLGLGQPEDVAAAAVFLAGRSGRYVTGATIDVNGGFHMR